MHLAWDLEHGIADFPPLDLLTSNQTVLMIPFCLFNAAIQAWRDAANDYARIQLVKQYFLCVEGNHCQTFLLSQKTLRCSITFKLIYLCFACIGIQVAATWLWQKPLKNFLWSNLSNVSWICLSAVINTFYAYYPLIWIFPFKRTSNAIARSTILSCKQF